jgi:protocatechuate 3,4-dioxygenase, beta subunit
MKPNIILSITISLFSLTACSQNNSNKQPGKQARVGGNCEGCEAIYESQVALEKLSWIDTLPDFNEPGPKMMISGTIYKADGKTPAPGVVLYVYHTDQDGKYSNKNNENGWAGRHGYIRGWMKSNENGQYRFYTLRPASYPNSNALQHIHPTILEPGMNEYWIDEFIFDDDPNLSEDARKGHPQRGGDGIIKLKNENGMLVGQRDIYLGRNIPGYPADEKAGSKTNGTQIDRNVNASLIPHPDTIIQ